MIYSAYRDTSTRQTVSSALHQTITMTRWPAPTESSCPESCSDNRRWQWRRKTFARPPPWSLRHILAQFFFASYFALFGQLPRSPARPHPIAARDPPPPPRPPSAAKGLAPPGAPAAAGLLLGACGVAAGAGWPAPRPPCSSSASRASWPAPVFSLSLTLSPLSLRARTPAGAQGTGERGEQGSGGARGSKGAGGKAHECVPILFPVFLSRSPARNPAGPGSALAVDPPPPHTHTQKRRTFKAGAFFYGVCPPARPPVSLLKYLRLSVFLSALSLPVVVLTLYFSAL
jgi:hypothetical protein